MSSDSPLLQLLPVFWHCAHDELFLYPGLLGHNQKAPFRYHAEVSNFLINPSLFGSVEILNLIHIVSITFCLYYILLV